MCELFVCMGVAGSAVVGDSGRCVGCVCWLFVYGCGWFGCCCDRGRSVAVGVCVRVCWGGGGGEGMKMVVCLLGVY